MHKREQQEGARISVKEAAKILGMSPGAVRYHMYLDMFKPPIGYVYNPTGKKNNCYIYKDMLDAHLKGINTIQEDMATKLQKILQIESENAKSQKELLQIVDTIIRNINVGK